MGIVIAHVLGIAIFRAIKIGIAHTTGIAVYNDNEAAKLGEQDLL